MATPVFPPGITVRGNVKLAFVTTLADPTAPKLTEINAGSSVDISCMLATDGWKPALEQNKGNVPRRVCSKNDREVLGAEKYTFPNLHYSNNPQGEDGSPGVKASETLVPGTTGYVVERLGLDSIEDDFAIDDYVNVWAITLGAQLDDYDLTDEFGEFWITQGVVAAGTGAPLRRVQVVA
ncbi:MAG: hypothetical protein P1U38_09595 [Aeromicrobium sp.]|uniref:phage tail tube protein n=1 Tax=Aeromicrobium sp. TaxID=1871063 RepID=UPI00261BD52A|nr:hypothetical protein [Aeromicrobium sp.]MDF1705014.1 hypothetical protein [Aeromicrobium sp.]